MVSVAPMQDLAFYRRPMLQISEMLLYWILETILRHRPIVLETLAMSTDESNVLLSLTSTLLRQGGEEISEAVFTAGSYALITIDKAL